MHRLSGIAAVELEVDGDEVGIVRGSGNAIAAHLHPCSTDRIGIERLLFPGREIGDLMLDVEKVRDGAHATAATRRADARKYAATTMLARMTVVWNAKSIAMIDDQPPATRWKFECGHQLRRSQATER